VSAAETFIARQPIFDRRDAVFGYELLFRNGPTNAFPDIDADLASGRNLEQSMMSFGLETLTQGRLAFVNLTHRLLVEELYTLLPPARSVLEVLETVEPDAALIDACRRAKDRGYRLALDDFVYRPDYEPLLELADLVKIDWRQDEGRRRTALERARSHGAKLVAEKVETRSERASAEALGFGYFQGYYFCRPEVIRGRVPSPSRANLVRLIREASAADLAFERVEPLIRQEIGFSVRLLRYLNSAGFGWRYEVSTIEQALRLLGTGGVRKWISAVATVALAEGKPTHLVVMALVRARMAEIMADAVGLSDDDLFLAGLFSLLDAVLDQPLEELLASMAVSAELAQGLLRRNPPVGPVLNLVVSQERGDWDAMARWAAGVGVQPELVQRAYCDAAGWAGTLIESG
jgi:EAL and modified HD-GYP domain-containing signal transduction protein